MDRVKMTCVLLGVDPDIVTSQVRLDCEQVGGVPDTPTTPHRHPSPGLKPLISLAAS